MSAIDAHHDYEAVGKALDRTLMRRLLPFVRPRAGAFALGLALLFVITGLEIASPLLLRHAVDGPAHAGAEALEKAPYLRALFWLAALYLLLTLATLASRFFQFLVLNSAGLDVLHRVRVALYAKLQRVPVRWFDEHPTGRLVTRVTTDVETLNELFTSGAVTLVGDVVKVAALLVVIFLLDVHLALIAVIAVPSLALASAFFRIRARQAYRETRTAIARVNSYLGETLAGMRVIHAFAREDKAFGRFAARNHEYLTTNLKTVFYFALFFPIVDWIAVAIQGATFWRGGIEIAGGHLTTGEFLQFWLYLGFIFEPLRELAERYNVLQSAMAAAERIFHVLDEREESADPADPQARAALDVLRGRVDFEDVRFAYRADRPVLRGVSFHVEPGETLALVGATGAGKTTITALLARFLEPDHGLIRVDGLDIRRFPRRALRRRIAYVPQDVFLFTGTVLDNLRLGGKDVDEERAREAARRIGAERFILRLPGGYDHVLHERGANLSAGERQLLAFARALAVDPAILVLDEATANVDPETEAGIQRAIATLLEGRTAIVVAHRLSTIRRATRILVLHHGAVRESGSHDELIAKAGLYGKLHRLQFSGDEAPGRVVGDSR